MIPNITLCFFILMNGLPPFPPVQNEKNHPSPQMINHLRPFTLFNDQTLNALNASPSEFHNSFNSNSQSLNQLTPTNYFANLNINSPSQIKYSPYNILSENNYTTPKNSIKNLNFSPSIKRTNQFESNDYSNKRAKNNLLDQFESMTYKVKKV